MNLFLLQMSGVPGSGKSTVARHVASTHGAIAIDYDVLKSAVLDAGIDLADSPRPAYEVMFALARQLLGQGHHVILDSPCHWPRILDQGARIAEEFNARYRYIECRLEDLRLIDERLGRRERLRSQRRGVDCPPVDHGDRVVDGAALFRDWMEQIQRPAGPVLQLDMRRALSDVLPQVDLYLTQ